MNASKMLTKRIAGEFIRDQNSIDLTPFRSIKASAAQLPEEHEGDTVYGGLKPSTTTPREICSSSRAALASLA